MLAFIGFVIVAFHVVIFTIAFIMDAAHKGT